MDAGFFDAVRPMFRGGRLTQKQVDGLTIVADYGVAGGYRRAETAYALATVHHETGRRFEPVREGFRSTDAGARAAVTALFNKGIIRRNYAAEKANGKSYYGRGYVQLTWLNNYRRFSSILGIPLVANPDLALDPDVGVEILYYGMKNKVFTAVGFDILDDVPSALNWRAAREIINRDVHQNGDRIAGYAQVYFDALGGAYGGN